MKKVTIVLLGCSHLVVGLIGFVAGLYLLPILIAPPGPSAAELAQLASVARYSTEFSRDRKDSDTLHWGEGKVAITDVSVVFSGKLAPGPDYRLYLSPVFVETEAEFERLKLSMVQVGPVRTFENFVVDVSAEVNVAEFTTVIVWCESFGEFITSAQYR
ncbi:DM13 domain-containing protein [Pontibacter sp. JAM-7]|uniref:DM13 domain-containing protein n=1 Tax=Pontibacter sp. JAM-7 TaxID=3366581 RepID=UPI003AF9FB96